MIGNADSIHVQRWSRHFAQRGFDVSLLSFYQPLTAFDGNPSVHFVRPRAPGVRRAGPRSAAAMGRFPGLLRLATAARLRTAGFYRELERINPDVVHAHYVSDYGVLAAMSGRHPLVVSAWGSDLLVDPRLSVITRRLVRWVLERADKVTYNSTQLRDAACAMGARPERLLEVVLGVGREMLEALPTFKVPPAERAPTIVSQRSLERPLYNVDQVITAMPEVLKQVPAARLLVGGEGALDGQLRDLAARLDVTHAVEFTGIASWPTGLAERLGKAAVYVSVPSSEGTSVTLLEAMAAGAYPVVSDLPSNREWVGENGGAVVAVRQVAPLAQALVTGLLDPDRRVAAAEHNWKMIEDRGLWDVNMGRMEKAYLDLAAAGRPVVESR
ncbi:MAG TPA: glycosyltransferase family 4 protein [Candidatus Acidoferrum sp.]|jgi:glycosyltransferase involved in cell wall biosynthesis|nr:glycosyltransferase family 4 protein [Candidatus Acidoferrum sp.]